MKKYDVVIIGSGVAGMSAAINLKRAGIDTLIIENDSPGGQINRTSIIENYPGIITDGPNLAYNIYKQVTDLKTDYLFDNVTNIIKEKRKIIIETNKEKVLAKYLIITSGRSPKKLKIESYDKFEGNGISYCAICDGSLYKNKNVAIVGGGAVATEEAIYLSNICNTVTIIHRNDTFKNNIDKLILDKINNTKNINILFKTEIKNITKTNEKFELMLNNKEIIKVDGIFVCIGYTPNTSFIDCRKDNEYIIVNKNYETSIKRIYAGGDVIKKDMYQIVSAVYDGSTIANKIQKLLSNH